MRVPAPEPRGKRNKVLLRLDPAVHDALAHWASDELRVELRRRASRTEPRTAAVLALAARGEISTVISRSERREHRQHLDELAVYTAWPSFPVIQPTVGVQPGVPAVWRRARQRIR